MGAEIKVTYNMLVQNKIWGVGATAGHTGFCGAAHKKCTRTFPHQGSKSKHMNEWLPLERVVGKFFPKSWAFYASPKLSVALFSIRMVLEATRSCKFLKWWCDIQISLGACLQTLQIRPSQFDQKRVFLLSVIFPANVVVQDLLSMNIVYYRTIAVTYWVA